MYFFLTVDFYLGKAMTDNPGYLRLRKIKAAQAISKTVLILNILTMDAPNYCFKDFFVSKSRCTRRKGSPSQRSIRRRRTVQKSIRIYLFIYSLLSLFQGRFAREHGYSEEKSRKRQVRRRF